MRVQIRMLLIRTASSQSKLAAYANQPFHSFIFCFIFQHIFLLALTLEQEVVNAIKSNCVLFLVPTCAVPGRQAGRVQKKITKEFLILSMNRQFRWRLLLRLRPTKFLLIWHWQRPENCDIRQIIIRADSANFKALNYQRRESEREGEKERERVWEKSMAAIHRWRLLTEISARMGAKPHSFRPQQPDRPHWWQDIYKPSFWNVALSPSIRSI